MIEEQIKIHDKYSIELKLGYRARRKVNENNFGVNCWIFIPSALDITRHTYSKEDFYRDLKTNIRLITPVYLLRDIAQGENSPFAFLRNAFSALASNPTRQNAAAYEYHLKMFLSIVKSAIREEIRHILEEKLPEDTGTLLEAFCFHCTEILSRYRDLRHIINAPTISENHLNYYRFADEFLSNIVESHVFKLLEGLKSIKGEIPKTWQKKLLNVVKAEIQYKREKGYPTVEKNSRQKNRDLIFRFTLLKKFAESELFLTGHKKRDAILIEQIYFSLAAGLSMVFATAVAFSFQQKYGNFTMPLFVALVVSYMLKDRIKELGRYYFAHKLGSRLFDHKTKITLGDTYIGYTKEAMDFIPDFKVPETVHRIRERSPILEANNRYDTEKIILMRRRIKVYRKNLDQCGPYTHNGIHEIIRLNVSSFLSKMDNPLVPLYVPDEDKGFETIKAERMYYINLILELRTEEGTQYKRYRVVLNRKGIAEIEEYN